MYALFGINYTVLLGVFLTSAIMKCLQIKFIPFEVQTNQ